jgi:CheY-like chemotaxis protein
MKTILVVDDSAVCREPMAAILESHGYRVLRAGDGVRGLELARAEEPDLILLDIVMPKMDGLTMLQALRDDPRHKDRSVILVTSTTDRSCILKARSLGVQGYLLKTSFSVDEMLSRVRACLMNPAAAPGTGAEALTFRA